MIISPVILMIIIIKITMTILGTCVQYPDLQGGGALGDASTPGTPAGSIAASAHGGTYSHAAVVGRMWGGERGAADATAAASARRRRATPTGEAVTLCARSQRATWGGGGGQKGRRRSGPVTLVAGESLSAT